VQPVERLVARTVQAADGLEGRFAGPALGLEQARQRLAQRRDQRLGHGVAPDEEAIALEGAAQLGEFALLGVGDAAVHGL
jgi:hypothetical protein